MQLPSSMARQAGQTPQGSPWFGFSQFTARARILAQEVLPVPRVPVNRYAWLSLPVSSCARSVSVTLFCPTTSENVCGRYLRYSA